MLVNRRIIKRISAALFALAFVLTEFGTTGVTVYADEIAESVAEATVPEAEEDVIIREAP